MEVEKTGIAPKVRLRDSIAVKLVAVILFLTMIAGAGVWLAVARLQERQFAERHTEEAGKIAAMVAGDAAKHMLAGDGPAVWKLISDEVAQYAETTGAKRILVLTGRGVVLAASHPRLADSRIDVDSSTECPGCGSTRAEDFPATAIVYGADGARVLRTVNRVPVSPACMQCHRQNEAPRSYVSIDFDLSHLDRAGAERQRAILAIGLISSLILAAIVTLLFRRLVIRPIDSLIVSMRRFASGVLAERAKVLGRNELSLLGHQFNFMAGRIEGQVERIEAAKTESALLYTLVVEASKSLETAEIAMGVARVIADKLHPRSVSFFLESADGGWLCASRGVQGTETLDKAQDALEAALASSAPPMQRLLDGVSPALVADACRSQTLQLAVEADALTFVLPVVSESRLIGILLCAAVPAGNRLDRNLLENLGAHLTLAAINSRNYTGAITDQLTQLKNKRYGLARLEEALFGARRHQAALGLAMCDLDSFKRVNDTHGHLAGDAVLREVARRIAANVRKADVAVRYGGEEFMLILPGADARALALIGEKLRHAVASAPFELGAGGEAATLTMSVGLAAFRADADRSDDLIGRADAALYRAKQSGRNRVEVSG